MGLREDTSSMAGPDGFGRVYYFGFTEVFNRWAGKPDARNEYDVRTGPPERRKIPRIALAKTDRRKT